ncbi:pyridoxal kinase [Aphelenchoides avenae]|nr:pyridoxal kinase [Aphelenchus avenae]
MLAFREAVVEDKHVRSSEIGRYVRAPNFPTNLELLRNMKALAEDITSLDVLGALLQSLRGSDQKSLAGMCPMEAMRNLHRTAHIRVVIVVTSGIYAEGPADLQYASEWHPSAPGTWNDADYSLLRFDTPVILGAFVGTWVVYSSLLVVGYTHFNGNLERAICAVISPVQGHLRRTSRCPYQRRPRSLLRFATPAIRGAFVSTWDIFLSLLVVWYAHFNRDLQRAICNVISSMRANCDGCHTRVWWVLWTTWTTPNVAFLGDTPANGRTSSAEERDLRLVESRYDLLVLLVKVYLVRVPQR